jgi:hypothetical protein
VDYIVSLSPESFELLKMLGRSPGFPVFRFTFSSVPIAIRRNNGVWSESSQNILESWDYSCGDSSGFELISPVFPFNPMMV